MTARTRVAPVDFDDLAGDEEAPIYAVDDGDPEALATADHRRPSVSRARRLSIGRAPHLPRCLYHVERDRCSLYISVGAKAIPIDVLCAPHASTAHPEL